MALVVAAVAMVFSLVCSVGSLVVTLRNLPPRLDPDTHKRVARALNRGTLPPEGPDRAAAIRLAEIRGLHYWSVLASLGLAAVAFTLIPGLDAPIPRAVPVVLAGMLLLGALIDFYIFASGRRALASA